ncbi:PIN domain-containing protein [Leptospira noumeaensis]|uniref:PIN domain-containing protein n=1 Tax=Leptospira noumeaensis TaxID=2484964 RepID=UPI001FCA745F|nr:PIN domain-containing protein [Leptospira noumeaensis]
MNFENIFNKALLKKRPFRENEKGFRDALIWENILQMVKMYSDDENPIVFISANINDFCSKEKNHNGAYRIHEDLKKDLAKLNLPENSVIVYTSLKQFFECEFSKLLNDIELLKSENLETEKILVNKLNNLINSEKLFGKLITISVDELQKSDIVKISSIKSARIIEAYRNWTYSINGDLTIRIKGILTFLKDNSKSEGKFELYADYSSSEKKFDFNDIDLEIYL